MYIILVVGDITEFKGDAIVNPANTLGVMGGGVALALKRKGGEVIEDEARGKAPIPIGSAVATSAGRLNCKFVIHAPTVDKPSDRSTLDNVYKATKAALKLAEEMKLKSLAIPLMGAGVGGLTPEESLRSMLSAILEFRHSDLTVHIYLRSEDLLTITKLVLSEYGLREIGENVWMFK